MPFPHRFPEEIAALHRNINRDLAYACLGILDRGSVIRNTVSLGAKILDVAEDLVAGRIRIECSQTLMLDILHPKRIIHSSRAPAQRRGARRAQCEAHAEVRYESSSG